MPSTVTHNYFAEDVLEKLNPKIKNKILKEKNIYKVFSNGPDPLFSYLGNNKYKKLGHIMHREKTGEYFSNVINYIKQNKLQTNEQVLAYLYGNITHYMLDSTIHPLVYYQTGRYIKGKKDRKKYKGKHAIMELTIDQYMIAIRNNKKIRKFKVHNFGIPKIKMNKELKNLIKCCTKDTYNINNIDIIINKAINSMRLIYKLFRYDKFGIKRFIYNILDKITLKKIPSLTIASYDFNYRKYMYYLNLKKESWFHPVDKEEITNDSFIELYIKAYKNTITLIEQIDKVLNNKLGIKKIYNSLNKSYLTGKSIEDNRKIKFFSH